MATSSLVLVFISLPVFPHAVTLKEQEVLAAGSGGLLGATSCVHSCGSMAWWRQQPQLEYSFCLQPATAGQGPHCGSWASVPSSLSCHRKRGLNNVVHRSSAISGVTSTAAGQHANLTLLMCPSKDGALPCTATTVGSQFAHLSRGKIIRTKHVHRQMNLAHSQQCIEVGFYLNV